ncbi:hypothetical protein Ciccas_012981 [Cichlidogyrus casuarinus]|uniref:Uncharacterized protein n=1 Tax=Cichlidogyrus casuarinus TaxID=1844966 RepID=A0ABD2PP74_9PLAT
MTIDDNCKASHPDKSRIKEARKAQKCHEKESQKNKKKKMSQRDIYKREKKQKKENRISSLFWCCVKAKQPTTQPAVEKNADWLKEPETSTKKCCKPEKEKTVYERVESRRKQNKTDPEISGKC